MLRRYVTNLDQPVFALVNLPEVVKGALFARYSRSPKSLRRLFLDEFVGELDISGDATVDATVGLERGGAALREGLRRIRRRFGRPTRGCPPRLRAGVERAVEGARVGTPHGLSRAVDALHRLQPAARERAVPLLPPARDPRLVRTGPASSERWIACSTPTARSCRRCRHGWPSAFRSRPATATSSTARPPAPSPSTRCAASSPRRHCRTSGSTAPASPTSSCCCACARTRFPKRATTPT